MRARFLGRESFELVEQLELEQSLRAGPLRSPRARAATSDSYDLALRLRRQIGAGAHRQRAGERAGQARGEDHFAAAGVAGHAGDDAEHGAEAVVDAVDRVANPAGAADVPALAAQDRVERRSRRRNLRRRRACAGRRRDRALRASPLRRSCWSVGSLSRAISSLVLGFGLVLFLLEAVQDDGRIARCC